MYVWYVASGSDMELTYYSWCSASVTLLRFVLLQSNYKQALRHYACQVIIKSLSEIVLLHSNSSAAHIDDAVTRHESAPTQ